MQDSGGSGDPRAWAGRQALIKLSLTTTVPGTSRECLFQGASAGISIAFCMLQFPSLPTWAFGTGCEVAMLQLGVPWGAFHCPIAPVLDGTMA